MSWRQLGSQPIGERNRSGAFAAAAAVLAVSAIVLLAIPDGGDDFAPPPRVPTVAERSPAPSPDRVALLSAAGRFMGDYLRFVYRGGAASFRAAAPVLAARLRRTRTRVPPGARERIPKVASIHLRELAPGLFGATAQVADAGVRYRVALAIENQHGRWLVIRVGAD